MAFFVSCFSISPSVLTANPFVNRFGFLVHYLRHSVLGQQIAAGETDPAGAMVSFYEAILEDKDRWLVNPTGFPGGWWMWAVATGYKNGRKARYFCWPSMYLDWTSTGLMITALRVLNGEIAMHGVFPPEACFELGPFLDEAVRFVPEEHRDKPLLNERFEWLD